MSVLTKYGTKRYGIGPFVIQLEYREQTPPTTTWTERTDTVDEIWTKRPDAISENWTKKEN